MHIANPDCLLPRCAVPWLQDGATIKDMILAIRADEACHSYVVSVPILSLPRHMHLPPLRYCQSSLIQADVTPPSPPTQNHTLSELNRDDTNPVCNSPVHSFSLH
jgi:hypothetical protein